MLERMKIGVRLGIGLSVILLFMIIVAAFGIYSLHDVNKKINIIVKQNNKQIWYANVIKDSVHVIDQALLIIIQAKDYGTMSYERVRIMTAVATYKDALTELESMESKDGSPSEYIDRVKTALTSVNGIYHRVVSFGRNEKPTVEEYLNKIRPATMMQLHQLCAELVQHEEAQSSARYGEAERIYRNAFWVFFTLFITVGGLATIIAVKLTRSITKPISEGVDIANRLANGDLSVDIQVKKTDETGQLLGAMKNMVERLKEAKELERQLIQSQKLETMGRLTSGIAHDFNNLLNVILGNAQLIKMYVPCEGKIQDRCISIEEAVFKAADFVKQLLAFSKKQTLDLKTVDLNRAVRDFEKMIRRMVNEDIFIEINMEHVLPPIYADISQINQVILNLIVNAREAMPHGGKFALETSTEYVNGFSAGKHSNVAEGEYVVLTAKDNGIGIDRELLSKIFEPFFTTKEHGTGLGLSVVYGIIKQHNGFIDVFSEVGKGTTFKVYLPAQTAATGAETAAVQKGELKKGSETILVVEDDKVLRDLLSETVKTFGYTVYTAADGIEGIEMFNKHGGVIDIVLLDVIMPKLGGRETYEEIKRIKPSVNVLFVTGYGPSIIDNNVLSDNGVGIIQKPYSAEAISKKIRDMLDGPLSRAM